MNSVLRSKAHQKKKNQGAPRLPPPPRCSQFSPALLPWPWVWWFLMDPGNCVCPRKLYWYEFPTRPPVPAVCMCWWRVCKLNWCVTVHVCLQLCMCWACVVTGVQMGVPAWSVRRDFIFLGYKITADGDCSHEIKRHLLLGRKVMTNLWSESESLSVVSDSLRPHRLHSPWNSPGQNTGVGSLSLLQGIFPTQGLNPSLSHCRQILYQLSQQGSPRILEWVTFPFSRGSSQPRNQTGVSYIAGNSLPSETLGKPNISVYINKSKWASNWTSVSLNLVFPPFFPHSLKFTFFPKKTRVMFT